MLKKIALVGIFAFASTVSAAKANLAGATKSAGPAVSVGAPAPKNLCYMYMCH